MTTTINGRTPEESVYTLEEVKKGLECCVGLDKDRPLCLDCPYRTHCEKRHCSDVLRQNALAYIQQLERERDAAVDMFRDKCEYCKHFHVTHNGCTPDCDCRAIECQRIDGHWSGWQWIGVQEVE